jgi:flagellar biosynthesis protein FliQ
VVSIGRRSSDTSTTMKTSVTMRLTSGQPWSIPLAAVVGFVVGIFLATLRHFSHDHPDFTPTALVEHFVPHLIVTVTACALLFALAAASHNRFMRKR